MKSQTSLVAQQTRLLEWAEQIKACNSRPIDMSVEEWCQDQGITRGNYYYRLRKVRGACLDHVEELNPTFVELLVPSSVSKERPTSVESSKVNKVVATLHGNANLSVDIFASATPDIIQTLIGALAYVK